MVLVRLRNRTLFYAGFNFVHDDFLKFDCGVAVFAGLRKVSNRLRFVQTAYNKVDKCCCCKFVFKDLFLFLKIIILFFYCVILIFSLNKFKHFFFQVEKSSRVYISTFAS